MLGCHQNHDAFQGMGPSLGVTCPSQRTLSEEAAGFRIVCVTSLDSRQRPSPLLRILDSTATIVTPLAIWTGKASVLPFGELEFSFSFNQQRFCLDPQ